MPFIMYFVGEIRNDRKLLSIQQMACYVAEWRVLENIHISDGNLTCVWNISTYCAAPSLRRLSLLSNNRTSGEERVQVGYWIFF